MVAIRKPMKTLALASSRSYRVISSYCVSFKILERLIYTWVEPIIDPMLSRDKVGFQRGRSNVDQVILLTKKLSIIFWPKTKSPLCFFNLTAAYDTVWHRGLICKQCRLLPDRYMVSLIMQIFSNRSYTLTTGNGKQRRLQSLKNGVPQKSVLAASYLIFKHMTCL